MELSKGVDLTRFSRVEKAMFLEMCKGVLDVKLMNQSRLSICLFEEVLILIVLRRWPWHKDCSSILSREGLFKSCSECR